MAGEGNDHRTLLSRREALVVAGALALYAAGCGGDDETASAPTETSTGGSVTTSTTESAADCVLTPEQTEGPYYIADSLVRRDITEGRDGAPLELRLTVQDATSCEPIENATVEVWHCDALGVYSGFGEASGERSFLRGAQRSDGEGKVRFRTIYPGWYQGRTTHIHLKVHVGRNTVHTGQLYFDEADSQAVYRRSPYDSHGEPTTTNSSDDLYANGGEQSTVSISADGDGYVGRLTLGVRA